MRQSPWKRLDVLLELPLNESQGTAPSDETLMASFLDGEQEAFYVLVERYRNRIVNFCFRMLGSLLDAEDAAQEVFLKLFLEKHRYRRGEPLRPWLYTIASNHCLNQLRRRKIIQWISLETPRERSRLATLTSGEARPDAQVQCKEETAWLEQQMDRLPARLRAPFLLKRLEGLTNRDIARILSISVSAVESRIHRALKRIMTAAEEAQRGLKNE